MTPLRSAEVVAAELHTFCKVAGHGDRVRELWTLLGLSDRPAFIAEMRGIVLADFGVEAAAAFDR